MNAVLLNALFRSDWNDVNVALTELEPDHRFLKRRNCLEDHYNRIKEYVPDYLRDGKSVLDFSCGNGASMEIFRLFGSTVFGTDLWMKNCVLKNPNYYKDTSKYSIFEPLLISQKLNYLIHNGSDFPYPFSDNSYDLVINVGSIHMYKGYFPTWQKSLNEFKRISKKTIFFGMNITPEFEKEKEFIMNWSRNQKDLSLSIQRRNYFRWDKKCV